MTESRKAVGPLPDSTVSDSPPVHDPVLEQLHAATLGTYEVHGELGRGGMATVYLAHDISLDRKVAIKVMSPALVHGPGMAERFKREARTAAHLSHPNIIPVYAVREADGLLFFVMKLVEGTPLDAIMREVGKLPLPMIEAILAQVGGALGYAHRHGVVHRDIKPSNIIIDDEGWAVVTDFGIAKVKESEGLTQSGVAVGTPTYMSPEQCAGSTITGASDQYSLGIVAYEMLAGRPPFTGPSMMPLMYSHFHDPPPPLEEFRADCPAQLRDAVYRMLAKDPAARFASIEDAVVALGGRHLAHDDPTRSQLITLARSGASHRVISQVLTPRSPIPLGMRGGTPPGVPAAPPAKPTRRAWLLVAAVAAVAAIAAVSLRRSATPEVTDIPIRIAADSVATPAPPAPAPTQPRPGAAVTAESPGPPAATRPADRTAATSPRNVVPSAPATPLARARDSTPAVASAPPAPAPAPPAPLVRPLPDSPAAPPARVVDDRADVTSAIMAYAHALDQGDLTLARRLYPGMTAEQRQDLEAFWKAAGTMKTQWTVTDVVVEGDVATARVRGSSLVTLARQPPSEQRVNLRARLERRDAEWRLIALVN